MAEISGGGRKLESFQKYVSACYIMTIPRLTAIYSIARSIALKMAVSLSIESAKLWLIIEVESVRCVMKLLNLQSELTTGILISCTFFRNFDALNFLTENVANSVLKSKF